MRWTPARDLVTTSECTISAPRTSDRPTRSSPVPRILQPRREYHCRKNRNEGKGDAVFNNLAYLPVCNCAPVCRKGCRNPYWMWTKKK